MAMPPLPRVKPVQVPLGHRRAEEMTEIPDAPSVAPSEAPGLGAASAPIPQPRPMQSTEGGMPLDIPDPQAPQGIGGEPSDEDGAMWHGIMAGIEAKAGTDNPLAAGLIGFFAAKSATEAYRSAARDKAKDEAREDEEWNWKREDRGLAMEDRELAKDDRLYNRGRQNEADERAARADQRTAQMHEYEVLETAINIDAKLKGGTLDGSDLLQFESGVEKAIDNLESLRTAGAIDDAEYDQRMSNLVRIYDDINRKLGASQRGAAPGTPPGIPDIPDPAAAAPGAGGGGGAIVGAARTPPAPPADVPDPVNPVGPGPTSGWVGNELGGMMEQPQPAPASPNPFPPQGEISGAGTPDDPIVGAPDDPEQVKAWAKLYLKPGQVFVWRGMRYQNP